MRIILYNTVYYIMPLTYMQCRDTKCTPNKVMEKERVTYMQTLKRKCSLVSENLRFSEPFP
jgi:hypothetical protein